MTNHSDSDKQAPPILPASAFVVPNEVAEAKWNRLYERRWQRRTASASPQAMVQQMHLLSEILLSTYIPPQSVDTTPYFVEWHMRPLPQSVNTWHFQVDGRWTIVKHQTWKVAEQRILKYAARVQATSVILCPTRMFKEWQAKREAHRGEENRG